YIDYGWTRPKVISRGAIPQGLPTGNSSEGLPTEAGVEELPSAEPTPARLPAGSPEGSPLSPPPTQEVRSQPRASTPRATVASPSSEESVGEVKTMPFGLRSTRSDQQVAPAAMWAETTGPQGNPLRSQRPIGTGVANQ
ncbi:MAG TPA: hypothetical protein VKH44_03445, partial [Pirellulaceae bacterium]|nr:hypothetical protein [Pirellulaceae bacterium]